MLSAYIPPLQWLKTYRLKDVKGDILSGITLAAYGIPVAMAYATLAGLPVYYGIYGYLIGGLFYAFFGTGMQVAIGPTSAISLLIGTSLATMANGDVMQAVRIASLTAMVMAFISLFGFHQFICMVVETQ
jgi:sulfate permease, SulP family